MSDFAKIREEELALRPGEPCLRHRYLEMNLLLPNNKRAQECLPEELDAVFAARQRRLGRCPVCGDEGTGLFLIKGGA